jgi:acyl-CoA synthetase (AMP-forming)/AMP-acid ligase II
VTLTTDEVEREKAFRSDDYGAARRLGALANAFPAREACVAVDGRGQPGASMTYAALDRRARAVAAILQTHATPGDRVMLVFNAGLDFGAALFACFYAGMIAVPVPAPRSASAPAGRARLAAIAADAEPRFVLTGSAQLAALRGGFPLDGPPLHWLAMEAVSDAEAGDLRERPSAAGETAILQYTSGSTAGPRGVEITHGNLAAIGRMIFDRFFHEESLTVVSWLPHFHDMGLIAGIVQTVFVGGRLVVLSPETFVKRPQVWLKVISDYRASISGAPNFAYEHCLRRIEDPEPLALDLSSWRVAFNGAEPVRAATLERFARRFASSQFRADAFQPCYGLAEATLMVTANKWGEPVRIGAEPRRLVSCGRSVDGQQLLIVDPESMTVLPDGETGEIWLSGPNVARGYFRNPSATRAVFGAFTAAGEGPFLRTGDLGFIDDGELFVSGRLKELIIIDGRNLYPNELEATAEASHEAIHRIAAFSVDAVDGERLVLVVETDERERARNGVEAAELERMIRAEVATVHQVAPYAVVFAPRGTIGRTTSGKLQRVACRTAYVEGRLGGTA